MIPIRLLMVGHYWIVPVEPRAMHKGRCFEWGHWIPLELLPGTARHTFGRDDTVLVTAWCFRADYEVSP